MRNDSTRSSWHGRSRCSVLQDQALCEYTLHGKQWVQQQLQIPQGFAVLSQVAAHFSFEPIARLAHTE